MNDDKVASNKIEITGELLNNTSEAEINFYKDTTNSVISRADTVIALIEAIAVMFTILTIFLSVLNFQISADLRSKLDSAAKLEDKVNMLSETRHELKGEVNDLKVMQHWVKGIVYIQNKNFVYAVEEFHKAEKIGNNDKVKLQLAIVHTDLLMKNIKENRFSEDDFKEAEHYLKEASNINEDEITCAESLLGLACLYGVVGKYYIHKDPQKSKVYFDKSKEHFDIARRKNKNNPEFYKNSAITYLYLKDIETMEETLKKGNNCIQIDERYSLEKKSILSAFEDDDKEFYEELMGEGKWDELEKRFG